MFRKLSTEICGSYTPDSEHVCKAMCSKNKQSLYEVFHFHEKDNIRDARAT